MVTVKDLIADWLRKRRTVELPRFSAAAEPPPGGRDEAGEYRLLCKYLRGRYANRVVLTFKEIEDLLGFSLPEPARLLRGWWGGTDAIQERSAQSDAWTLASMTATVNLSAQSVVFERHAWPDARPGRS